MKDDLIECCKCKWAGKESELDQIKTDPVYETYANTCPKYGSLDFYLLSVDSIKENNNNGRLNN